MYVHDVFLSYNSRDEAAVQVIARQLHDRKVTVFLDRWYLVPGQPWPQHLESVLATCRSAVVVLGAHGLGEWQRREHYLALARQACDSSFPVIPVILPGGEPGFGFLSLNTWVDLRHGIDDDHVTLLAAAIRREPIPVESAARSTVCPYRGLRYFREEDAPFFFGRDAFIARLQSAVGRHALVAVVGASGSGKSSVVHAGLIPRLRRSTEGTVWDVATMVPGDRPFHALAAVVGRLLEPELTEIDRLREVAKMAVALEAGEVLLRDTVSRILEKQPGTDRLMLIVDQWEELYADTRDSATRERFIDEVLSATASAPLSILFTIRGDFFDHVLGYRPLSDRIQDAVVNVSQMTREELRDVLERPAQTVALRFAPGLVNRILDKVQPGNLPLLEFVLTELWRQRQADVLSHEVYESLGELPGAISMHAESIYSTLSAAEQELTRRLFLQLVRHSAGGEVTRRRTPFGEVGDVSLPVVRKLTDAHLVVTGRDDATASDYVEIVHEALIGGWSRLQKWIDADREFLAWREQLRTLIAIADDARHRRQGLLRGTLLSEAREWARKRSDDLSSSERRFIQTSIDHVRRTVVLFFVVAAFLSLIVMYASYLVMGSGRKGADRASSHAATETSVLEEMRTDTVINAEPALVTSGRNSTQAAPTNTAEPTLSLPMRVWIPAVELNDTHAFASALRDRADKHGLKWITDPGVDPPKQILRLGSKGWELISDGAVVASQLDQVELLAAIPKMPAGSALLVEFPPPSKPLGMIDLSSVRRADSREAADYALVCHFSPSRRLSYAWVRTGRSDRNHALPFQRHWEPGDDQRERADNFAGHAMTELLLNLNRIYGLHALESPPESRFPYHLVIRDETTGLAAQKIIGKRHYQLILQTSESRISPRYVYVLAIDSRGSSKLLFPPGGATGTPLPSAPSAEIVLDGGGFVGAPPYGLDTFFLLASEEPLTNPWLLEWGGVRQPAAALALEELKGWSLEKVQYESVAP